MALVTELEELFADEMLIFVMDESYMRNQASRNLKQTDSKSLFTASIQFGVRRNIEKHEVTIKNIFNLLLGDGNLNENFGVYSKIMTSKMVFRGYNEGEFIQFCAVICKLAVLAYRHNYRNCLMDATTAIVNAIKLFKTAGVFPKDGWTKLHKVISFG